MFKERMMKTALCMCFCVLLLVGSASAQDSATFDPQRGVWTLRYQDPETNQWVEKTYAQRTAIEPTVRSTVRREGSQLRYEYLLRNGRGARQNISVIHIWGIPTVYPVPNLPVVTASARSNTEEWTQQVWDQLTAKSAFEKQVVAAPTGWIGGLRVDEEGQQTSIVFGPGLKDTDSYGVEPGRRQAGFVVRRPELPGVARMWLQGRIRAPWTLDLVPPTPYWQAKVEEIEAQDYLLVPVLAPVISIPEPYDGVELARRIRAHVQTWLTHGHASANTLERLNRQFDALIPALQHRNKVAARAAATALLREAFSQQPGMEHRDVEEDDDAHAARALPKATAQRTNETAARTGLDRVAVRALVFDVMFLLTQLEKQPG